MATLENIRKRGPIIAVVIGLALAAFILGDLLTSGQSLFQSSRNEVANINGNTLTYEEYTYRLNEMIEYYKLRTRQTALDESTSEQIRSSVWEIIVREYSLKENLLSLGIGVSKEELFDMVQGNNVDQSIQQAFTNQETGMFDKNLVMQFLKEMENDKTGQSKAIWVYLENEIKENRFYNKYYTILKKGLYVTKAEAEAEYTERGLIVDLEFATKTYASILDTTIAVSDKELSAYYKEHKKEYKQEESFDLAYVTFDVLPTKEDSNYVYKNIAALYEGLVASKKEDVEKYINLNSDKPYTPTTLKKATITNPKLDSLLFNSNEGFVYGPYTEGASYRLVRLLEKVATPDSVKASHILISIQTNTKERANAIADSLMTELKKKDADFAATAQKHSEDKGSAIKGGDLDWFTEGMMVTEFNDACFNNKVGDMLKVETQFGVHIIKITDQTKPSTKVKVAYLDLNILPSDKTFGDIYTKANKFAGENQTSEKFEKAIVDNKLTKKLAPALTKSTAFIAGLENPRELIRWAYEAEKNSVSTVFDFNDKYVVALLTEKREKGFATPEQVKDKIEIAIRKDKKAEQIINDIKAKNITDVQAAAAFWGTTATPAGNVSFNAYSIVGAGYEPVVIAKAVTLEKDKVVGPIKGSNGVYFFKVTSITPPVIDDKINWDENKKRLTTTLQGRTNYQAFEAIKKAADMTDNRIKFF